MNRPVVAMVLESDVAAVFDSLEVYAQLRSAIPARTRRKRAPRARAHHSFKRETTDVSDV